MSRCFVSFVVKLWSTDPDKWPFSPTKLHGAIPIFKNRDCAFLFARIIHKEDLSTMSMKHRHFFILDRTVWRSTTSMDRPENFFRSIASPKHCFRSSGFKICQPMLCIGGQILKSLLLKKSLWNAEERKEFSGLSVKVVKGHTILSRMKKTMIHWHGWQILLIDNSCKQKAQLRLMKIEIARCNLAGGEKSFVGVVWPQFDHKRNETSWHPMKQNGIMHLKFNDTESRQYRIVHCVFERSTMGFKRPWVRFSPLGPDDSQPNNCSAGNHLVRVARIELTASWTPLCFSRKHNVQSDTA